MLLNPYLATTGVGTGGGPTYFFEERFEDVSDGYENSWTESGTGTKTANYTGVVLEGSQSLRLAGTAQSPQTVSDAFTSDLAELWAFFRLRIVVSFAAARPVFVFRNSSGTAVGGVSFATDNGLQPTNGTITASATTDKPTTGTDYNVWYHWIKSTGATDGVASVAFSVSGTEPVAGNTFRTMANGNSVTDAHDLRLGWTTNTTAEVIIDKILVSDTATIGNDPA